MNADDQSAGLGMSPYVSTASLNGVMEIPRNQLVTLQAGICILHEAGGAAFGSKTSSLSGDVDAELIGKLRIALRSRNST